MGGIYGVGPVFNSVVNATGPQPLADQTEYSKEVCRRTQVMYRYVRSGYCWPWSLPGMIFEYMPEACAIFSAGSIQGSLTGLIESFYDGCS